MADGPAAAADGPVGPGSDARAAAEALLQSVDYWRARRTMKEAVLRVGLSAADIPAALPPLMEQLGVTTALRNLLHQHCEQRARAASLPPPASSQPPPVAAPVSSNP
jgi:hypothetical protein